MDTTANKLRDCHPVCIISAIDSENNSIILGQALLHDEKINSWQFVLESLRKQSEGLCPEILWTDDDPAIPSAIENTYGAAATIRHLLCDWHVKRNVHKKLYFNKVGRAFSSIESAFIKLQYSTSEAAYELYMKELLILVDNYSLLVNYFQNLSSFKYKWCHAFRTSLKILGNTGTQRGESLNRIIANTCNKSTSILTLISTLSNYVTLLGENMIQISTQSVPVTNSEKFKRFAFANLREELCQCLSHMLHGASNSDVEKVFKFVEEFKNNSKDLISSRSESGVSTIVTNSLINPTSRRKGKPKGKNLKNRPETNNITTSSNNIESCTPEKRFFSQVI